MLRRDRLVDDDGAFFLGNQRDQEPKLSRDIAEASVAMTLDFVRAAVEKSATVAAE